MTAYDFLSGMFAEAMFFVEDFVEYHPFLTMLIVVALFLGGCGVAVKIHIVSSTTKLMPY